MKRQFIVDGYNVIHRLPSLRKLMDGSLEAARAGLVAFCLEWLERRGDAKRFVVVFDGDSEVVGGRILGRPGVMVLYSASGETADERISQLLGSEHGAGGATVVSDDSGVRGCARSAGAAVMSVEEFSGALRARQTGGRCSAREPEEKSELSGSEQARITEELKKCWGVN